MDRNMQLAARAGQSSLTLEEEARINLLLGDDTEGDEPSMVAWGSGQGQGSSNQEEEKEEDDLMSRVYGGEGDKRKVVEIDQKLREMGALDALDEGGEASPMAAMDGAGAGAGEGVLRARARERAEKEKERTIDETLAAIKNAEFPVVVDGGVEEAGREAKGGDLREALSAAVRTEDIKALYEDVKGEIEMEGGETADQDDIKTLLARMNPLLERQAEARNKANAGKRAEIENVIKKYADDIGDLYQSQWEGDGEFDPTESDDEAKEAEEGKEAEEKEGGREVEEEEEEAKGGGGGGGGKGGGGG
jgi:hypothetical protein